MDISFSGCKLGAGGLPSGVCDIFRGAPNLRIFDVSNCGVVSCSALGDAIADGNTLQCLKLDGNRIPDHEVCRRVSLDDS